MKRLLAILFGVALFWTSCDMPDSLNYESENQTQMKAAELKMVPIKGELQSHVTEYYNEVPVIGILSGNLSHFGKLVAENSVWYTTAMEIDSETWTISWEMIGSTSAASGDLLYFLLSGTFSIPDNALTAHVDFESGTGKYENASGYLEITGYADDPQAITTMFMKAKGMISNVGSNHSGSESPLISQNESIARSFIKAWDAHDAEMLASLFADEFTYTEITTGHVYADKDALAMYVNGTISGIPDSRFEVVSVVANQQYAAVKWIWKGTNTVGWPQMGIPATQKYFEFPGVSIMMIENQKISWDKDYWDWSAFLQAIGVVP